MPRIPQTAVRAAASAQVADSARAPGASVAGTVRARLCPVCGTGQAAPCQVIPPGDHFGRWLAAFRAGTISRADFTEVVVGLVVITDNQVIQEATR